MVPEPGCDLMENHRSPIAFARMLMSPMRDGGWRLADQPTLGRSRSGESPSVPHSFTVPHATVFHRVLQSFL